MEYALYMQDFVREAFLKDGKFEILSAILANKDPEGHPLPSAAPFLIPIPPQASKDLFSHALRILVRKTQASGILFMSEVWTVLSQTEVDTRKYPCLGDHPDAREALMITFEHRTLDYPIIWTAIITRENGSVQVGPFEASDNDPMSQSGRFMHLLKSFDTNPKYN